MGFFSKVRKRIKKIIPKEVRPFVPYLAAMIPGLQAMGPLSGIGSLAARKALIAGGTKFLTDDEADLKDIGITAALAGGPSALQEYGASSLPGTSFLGEGATTAGDYLAKKKFTTLAAQGGIDAGIKAAELNEDALERYNRELAEQGINDKAGRRAAIRGIYANTGTWDMDEVDSMLDTYGYRTGGRVGYEGGDLVDMEDVILASMKGKKKKDKDDLAATEDGKDSKDIPMKDVIKSAIFDSDKERDSDLEDNINMMSKSYKILYPEVKENRIRPLSFEDGGSVDDRLMERVKELQDEGLDFASALSQAMKEDMAANKARGGIMDGIDVNMEEQIDTPRGDMMIDENIKVADSSLMDAYKIYRFDMMEQGLEPMSLEEFRDQAMAEGKMANMDYREFIYDASRDNFANDMFGKDYGDLNEEETEEVDIIIEMELGKNQAAPERTMAASGGLMNLGGREMDLRGGGFVPMGAKERADDVPARLSKNEFVMTADAVRAAGGGSVQKGADLMYDQMKQLERQA